MKVQMQFGCRAQYHSHNNLFLNGVQRSLRLDFFITRPSPSVVVALLDEVSQVALAAIVAIEVHAPGPQIS